MSIVDDLRLDGKVALVTGAGRGIGEAMAAQRHGKIINITSMAAIRGFEQLSIYGMTKAAVGLLTQVLGVEWAQYDIQVNGIAPGWVATSMTASRTNTPEWRLRWVQEQVPQSHFGQPKDIAGIAVYLASSVSDFCTGKSLQWTVDSQPATRIQGISN